MPEIANLSAKPTVGAHDASQRFSAVAQDTLDQILLRSIVDYAIFMISLEGTVLSWNVGAERLKGFTAAEIVGRSFSVFYTLREQEDKIPETVLAAVSGKGSYVGAGWRLRKDGSAFWARVALTPVLADDGAVIGFAKITQDLTREKQQDEEFQLVRSRLELALGNMSHGLALFDSEERICLWNARWLELTGTHEHTIHPGIAYVDIVKRVLSGEGLSPAELATQARADCDRLAASLERAKGAVVVEERQTNRGTHVYSHRSIDDGGWVSTVEDVTERRRIEERLTYMTRHDTLTGLKRRTATWIPTADILGGSAFLHIDLRRFKMVINARGYDAGDLVLQTVAERISAQLLQREIAIRLGGDEFIVVVPGCASRDHAQEFADRLSAAIEAPIALDAAAVFVTVDIGISLSPRDGLDFATMLDKASLALHAQQATGLKGTKFYEKRMDTSKRERGILEQELHDALSRQDFKLAFQPIISADGFQLSGFEALLRWTSPSQGIISPASFVPLAEELGLMCDIDEWVLRAACETALEWDQHIVVSVNLSATQLRKPGLANRIRATLLATGLPANRLEMEITETAYIDNLDQATMVINEVRALGISIALDDFGTGFSSLSLLKKLPFTRIKIDQSFIRDMATSPQSSAIVQAVCTLCENLGVQVTAEGVESADLALALRARGCTDLQGYFFGRPMAACSIGSWIKARNCNDAIYVQSNSSSVSDPTD